MNNPFGSNSFLTIGDEMRIVIHHSSTIQRKNDLHIISFLSLIMRACSSTTLKDIAAAFISIYKLHPLPLLFTCRLALPPPHDDLDLGDLDPLII